MIQKIKSTKVELPTIYLVENEKDWNELPIGLPRILANQSELPFITTFLEFQVLYKSCLKTNLPIKWLECLKRIGFNINNIREFKLYSGGTFGENTDRSEYELGIDNFIEAQYFVNFDTLSELKILPKWLEDLKTAIQTNIIDEVTFDPTAFNKQLGLNVGSSSIKHNMKNLLILDISASIPKSIVISITNLAKLMSKKFYADIILTGRQSLLIEYDNVPTTDIIKLSKQIGGGNEGSMYKEIISKPKQYNTVISFGDNDSPSLNYSDCKFTAETLYSLHTDKSENIVTGYVRCFKPKTTHIVKNWVNTIN